LVTLPFKRQPLNELLGAGRSRVAEITSFAR
jgi:hypothetical protein